jgi:hypothetical protein
VAAGEPRLSCIFGRERVPEAGLAAEVRFLDELAIHATSLPDDLRTVVAAACRRIVNEHAAPERCTSRLSVGGARCVETVGHAGAHCSGGSVWQDD